MRTTYRWDKDLECLIEVGRSNYFEEKAQGPNVISDDMGAGVNGLKAMYRIDGKHFDSKSSYRADVKAHGLAEVGNETNFADKPATSPKDYYQGQVKIAYEQYQGNYNGIADRVNNERLRKVPHG
jgi:hypothetical protein